MAEFIDTNADQVHADVGSLYGREETSDVCEPCKVGNTLQPARGWCETCDEQLCHYCLNIHCRNKIMRNHQICSLEERRNRKGIREFSRKCQEHKGKRLKYFCEDHKEFGCSLCFVNKHRPCCKVICITAVCTRESKEFKALNLLYSKLEERLNPFDEKIERNLRITGRQHNIAITAIDDAGKQLKRLIDKLIREQIAKAQQVHDENIRNLGVVGGMKKKVVEELSIARGMLDVVKGDNNQLFITMKHLQDEAKVLESKINIMEQRNNVREYEFMLNPELARILETVAELGVLMDAQVIKIERSSDEVVQKCEEVQRFCSSSPYALWDYRIANYDAIQMSTDSDIMLWNVLLFPCIIRNTNVELSVSEMGKCLIKCASTHVKSDAAFVAVDVINKGGKHGIQLKAGHTYDIGVRLNGTLSHYGVNGRSNITMDGVKFTFSNTTPTNRTSVDQGQIPGFRFTHL